MYSATPSDFFQINKQVKYLVAAIKSTETYYKKGNKLLSARKVLVALIEAQTNPDFPGLFLCNCKVN